MEYKKCTEYAGESAKLGNRTMMEHYISRVEESGRKAGICQDLTANMINMWRELYCLTQSSGSVDNSPRRRSEESSATPRGIPDEVIVEKTVTLEERLDQRLREEQDVGRVIKLE